MRRKNLYISIISFIVIVLSWACNNEDFRDRFYSENDVPIAQYLQNDENYTECVKALKRSNLLQLLSLAGDYTFFAADNNAFNNYYNKLGVNGLSDLTDEQVTDLMKNALIEGAIESVEFRAGRLSGANLLGDYLIMNFGPDGINSIYVNNTLLSDIDISVSNGIIHKSTGVIEVIENTLADLLETTPEYSIFYQGMVETGIIDSISRKVDADKVRYTLLVENNTVFQDAEINSFDDLKAKYSNTEDLKDPNNALNVFFRYHIVDWYLTLTDFQPLMYPTVYKFPIVVEVANEFIINRHDVDEVDGEGNVIGTKEVYQTIDYLHANIPAWNGVIHELKNVMEPYLIYPSEVSFEGESLQDTSLILDKNLDLDLRYNSPPTYFVYDAVNVGDYIEFTGPYLFPVKYYVYMTIPSYQAGRTLFGFSINGEKVGKSFVNAEGEIFVGVAEVTTPGLAKIKLSVDGNHTNPDDNVIRCDRIRFVPDL